MPSFLSITRLRPWLAKLTSPITRSLLLSGARASDSTIEDSNELDLHRGIGFLLTNPVALLPLIVALLAWLPDKRLRIISIVLPFLLFIQMLLAEGGRWVAALHPVNAFVLLGLLGYLASRLWRADREPAPVSPTAV